MTACLSRNHQVLTESRHKRVLVALSGMFLAEELITLISQSLDDNYEYMLLNVLPATWMSNPTHNCVQALSELDGQKLEERKRAEVLAALRNRLTADRPEATVSISVDSGKPIHRIFDMVKEWNADEIVLISQKRSGFARLLNFIRPSTTAEIVKRSPVPVKVLKLDLDSRSEPECSLETRTTTA